MASFSFHDMNINQFILWFFIYSFCGWCMECLVLRYELGHWQNRGFVKMPFCIIYGFGTFIGYNLLGQLQDNYIALYFVGALSATVFEYITAILMNRLFGEIWWNYEHKKFNYKGILCLESTLGWGLLVLFIFGIFNRYVEKFVTSLNQEVVVLMSVFLMIIFSIDFTYHFTKAAYSKYTQEDVVNNSFE